MAPSIAMIDDARPRRSRTLRREDELVFPMAKAAVLQPADDRGTLLLLHGASEIAFETPGEVAFATKLAKQKRFRAADAADWSTLSWNEVRPMLKALLAEGVLDRAGDHVGPLSVANEDRPSPLPPAPSKRARTWRDDDLMQALTGRTLEPGYLEAVVPIFRVAHMFRDSDGRQIGEANVFPTAMRLETPTQWRSCTYPGTRHQLHRPMNVTALRAMRAHWRQMMALLAAVRAAYQRRCPDAADGWTVGHVERLTTAVLALPSLLLLRADNPVADGALHPALSNLFRVTDGLRMVMHQMLFVPGVEAMRVPDSPVTAAEILAYAERNNSFHSPHGVCAGPRFMIEDFLAVLLDGAESASRWPEALDAELAAAVDAVEPAIEYAFLGLQTYAAVFGVWPAMARAYDGLAAALETVDDRSPDKRALREQFAAHRERMAAHSYLGDEDRRRHREAVFDDMAEKCALGLGDQGRTHARSLDATALVESVSAMLGERLGPHAGRRASQAIVAFLQRAQLALAATAASQRRINDLLGRPQPVEPLTLADLDLHNRLIGDADRSLLFLPDELAARLGIRVHVDQQTISVAPVATVSPSLGVSPIEPLACVLHAD